MQIDTSKDRSAIKAVLGPTNTGKTHLAMERMLAHESGVIGFPLRLLARENYDRAVKIKGKDKVALVTGEEKIVPPGARYFLTTVESMPTGTDFAFVAIDEIQMCADADRGHIFTQRLLDARGTEETMFLGAQTIRPVIQQLVPDVEFISRPRLSTLTYTGYRKLTKLKARSCIVAFSAADVYSIAEMIRRTSGGAAIVMGALSPRTRNAQVEMFQSGEVDYLVATDAVGMGLNMDVDHVALAATRKFDGRMVRDLSPAELAQIAGRAGRHMNDGTFGTTADITGLSPIIAEAITSHSFKRLNKIFWRNPNLNYSSLDQLAQSLQQMPEQETLIRAREADDEAVLNQLAKETDISALATTPDAVRLLWDVCRVPDFRRIAPDEHAHLLSRIYRHLMGADKSGSGCIPADWLAERVKRIDRTDGDIDTLMARIAFVRTWTFVSHQVGWLDDPEHWQGRTRAIEDKLSDALHEKLTQRFVDVRTSQLAKSLKTDQPLDAQLLEDGKLEVEGHLLGHLAGFRFVAEKSDSTLGAKVLDSAVNKALNQRIQARLSLFASDADGAFTFTPDAQVLWRGEAVASLVAGPDMLRPDIKARSSDLLSADDKGKIEARLKVWISDLVRDRLGLLLAAENAPLQGVARGLVFQLRESLGALPRHEAEAEIKALEREDRQALRKLGIRIGRHLVYIPALLRPAQVELSVLLWAVHAGEAPLAPPPPGRVSLKKESHQPEGWLRAAGFRPAGSLFVRADMLERISELAWKKLELQKGAFEAGEDFLSLAGCAPQDIGPILKSLGFVADAKGKFQPHNWRRRPPKAQARPKTKPKTEAKTKQKPKSKPAAQKRPKKATKARSKPITKPAQKPKSKPIDPDSPFAKLQHLKLK